MTLGQVAAHARDQVREPTSDSWTQAQAEEYVRATYLDWCQELQWPEGTLEFNSVAGVREYALPANLNSIFRVFINGHRAGETTIPLLEGEARGINDSLWRTLPAVQIPPRSWAGDSGILSVPITAGVSGKSLIQYYLRGGNLGFHPKPAGVYPIVVEGSFFPAPPETNTVLLLPDQFKDGLAFGAVKRFLASDRRLSEAEYWRQLEEAQFQNAMRWVRRMSGRQQTPVAVPVDYRGWYGRPR